jgi:hypothetical protein
MGIVELIAAFFFWLATILQANFGLESVFF